MEALDRKVGEEVKPQGGDEEWLWPQVEQYRGDGHGEGSAGQGSGERESARPRRNAPKPARYRD